MRRNGILILAIMSLFLVLLVSEFAWAPRLPQDVLKSEGITLENLEAEVRSAKNFSTFMFLLLVLSIGANLYLQVVMNRKQMLIKHSMDTIREIDLLREMATRIAVMKTRWEEESRKQISIKDEIQILRSGIQDASPYKKKGGEGGGKETKK